MIAGYTALSVIGRGAGSTIHRVRQDSTGQIFALKEVRKSSDPEGRFFEQIENEARAGQAVSHPNVRQIYELHRRRQRLRVTELYLLMEYLEGGTLGQANPPEPERQVDIFTQVALGLQALHQAGYVHSDIKPGNIMVGPEQTIKILDLGQSCKLGAVKTRIQGTPDFIAPEQVLRLPLGERTDVFNLGATMYWCLTGRTFPTRIKTQQKAGAFDLNSPRNAETPQEVRPETPGLLSNLVMDCCRNNPGSRPDMPEVLARLRSIAHATKIMRK